MARLPVRQFSFTAGWLDPGLSARTDIAAYYAGAREVLNMEILPHGGVRSRPGTVVRNMFGTNVARDMSGPHVTSDKDVAPVRIAGFQNGKARYIVTFAGFREIVVYNIDVFTRNFFNVVGDVKNTPWEKYELSGIQWVQSLDTMIIVHPDHAPRRLIRERDKQWKLELLPLTNIPTISQEEASRLGLPVLGPVFALFGAVGKSGKAPKRLPVWSADFGWPGTVTFHEGRLYFGGSRSFPQTIWGSTSNNYFDFKTTDKLLDDESVETSLDSDRVSRIQRLHSMKGLFAFTSGGLFALEESPVTPKNFFFRRHSELPAAPVRPVEVDGSLMYLREDTGGHQSLHEMVYDDARKLFITADMGLMAPSIVRNPVAMATQRGSADNVANRVYLVNRDGTVAVLYFSRSEKVAAWALWRIADTKVRDIVVTGERVFFLATKRGLPNPGHLSPFDVGDQRILELDGERHLDWSYSGTLSPGSIRARDLHFSREITGKYDIYTVLQKDVLSKFRGGLTIYNISRNNKSGSFHGFYHGYYQFHPDSALNVIKSGIPFVMGQPVEWVVETMPLDLPPAEGGVPAGRRRRILRSHVRVLDTPPFRINGRLVATRRFPDRALGLPPNAEGLVSVRGLGWRGGGQNATVRLTGDGTRGRATILGLTVELAL